MRAKRGLPREGVFDTRAPWMRRREYNDSKSAPTRKVEQSTRAQCIGIGLWHLGTLWLGSGSVSVSKSRHTAKGKETTDWFGQDHYFGFASDGGIQTYI